MATFVEAISTAAAVELISTVWVEVTMASMAALVWCAFTGTVFLPKGSKKLDFANNQPAVEQGKRSPRNVQLNSVQLATTALRQGKVAEAVALLQQVPEVQDGQVPANVAPRLLMAVAKAPNFDEALAAVKVFAGQIEARALEAVVLEAAKNKDTAACRQLMALCVPMLIVKSPRTLESLARVFASDLALLRMLIDETEAPLAPAFAGAVLEACAALRETDLALEVFEKVSETDAAALRVVAEKASQSGGKPAADKPSKAAACVDASKNEAPLAKEIRVCGKSGNLKGAVKVFERASNNAMNTFLYNSILEACIECGDREQATHYLDQAESKGLVDVVSYNIVMKGYLAKGDLAGATRLLKEIPKKGLCASHSSYHGLLNALVMTQRPKDLEGAWKLVQEMRGNGVAPNMITCAILLKSKANSGDDISRILALLEASEEKMDEVFFGAVIEACSRANCLDVLSKQTAKFASQGGSLALTAPTYGSMIKAYGQMWDVKRVLELWDEMMSNKVQPTAVTLGCMVEALVSNRRTAHAWKIVQQMASDESTRALVNTVIYSTIIKGFACLKEVDKVMALYEEMRSRDLKPNTITYNTVLNAFAQGGAMDRVPALLEDMKTSSPPVEPDIVTYSTIVKGFCYSGCLDKALKTMQEMQANGKLRADEMMYNSLLDGCAKEQRPDDALKLIGDMKKAGVPPSNYTLSMVGKLMGRCKRLSQGLALIEEIRLEYGLKLNIQVYTCLIQACFNNRQAFKGLALHDQMLKEGCQPDEMLYSCLVKGCMQAGLLDKAVQLTKCAHGVGGVKGKGMPPGIGDRCLAELMSALGGAGSAEAKALKAELGACSVAPRKGSGKGSSKGGR
jgi:pentatricopeptide repeat protein